MAATSRSNRNQKPRSVVHILTSPANTRQRFYHTEFLLCSTTTKGLDRADDLTDSELALYPIGIRLGQLALLLDEVDYIAFSYHTLVVQRGAVFDWRRHGIDTGILASLAVATGISDFRVMWPARPKPRPRLVMPPSAAESPEITEPEEPNSSNE